jgi:nucleoside-triphosphatase THEP1
MIFGITGAKGIGKTWVCESLVNQLTEEKVFGFYSPPVFEGNTKTGIDVVVLPGSRRIPFARLAWPGCILPIGRWCMDPQAFESVNQHLRAEARAQVFLADEIGPYELEDGKGWPMAIQIAENQRFPVSVITFRPSLMALIQERMPEIRVLSIQDRNTQREALAILMEVCQAAQETV